MFFSNRANIEDLSRKIFRSRRNAAISMVEQSHRELRSIANSKSDIEKLVNTYLTSIPSESWPAYFQAKIRTQNDNHIVYSFSEKMWDRTKFRNSYKFYQVIL